MMKQLVVIVFIWRQHWVKISNRDNETIACCCFVLFFFIWRQHWMKISNRDNETISCCFALFFCFYLSLTRDRLIIKMRKQLLVGWHIFCFFCYDYPCTFGQRIFLLLLFGPVDKIFNEPKLILKQQTKNSAPCN